MVPWVKAAEPYSDKHMDVAWENPQILRMMSNENLMAPSEAVLDAVLEAARLGNLYPGSGPELRRKLGEAAGLTADHVVLGRWLDGCHQFRGAHLRRAGRRCRDPVPTFPMYAARIRVAGGKCPAVPMRRDFYWDVDAMLKAVTPRTKLVFVCSPNNPTGNQIDEAICDRILELGVPTFFDEAYYELEDACRQPRPAGSRSTRT